MNLEAVLARDALGVDASGVEAQYRELLVSGDQAVWAAYLCFLLTRSRSQEAIELYPRAQIMNPVLKLDWVKTLLRRTHIEEGLQILDSDFKDDCSPPVDFLKGYAENLKLARDEYAVFPTYVNPRRGWHEPQLPHDVSGPGWKIMPGRLEADTGEGLIFLFGRWKQDLNRPEYCSYKVSYEDYRAWGGNLEQGPANFVEVLAQDGKEISWRCYSREELTEEELSWIEPRLSTERYLLNWR